MVYLVGMMGAGKTTIGRKLAKALSCEFADLDREIEESTGVTIPTIFEIEGEAGFRRRESLTLKRLQDGPIVVATGGGAILSPANRVWMSANGFVVYLHAPVELLFARTKNDKGRPLLQVADPLARIRSLVERRDPLYREIADLVVESGAGVNNTVNSIRKALESPCTP